MVSERRSYAARYGVAVGATLVALVVRLVLGQMVQMIGAFVLFTPAVMVAAWYGGLGPGLLATALGALLANYFLLSPTLGLTFGSDELMRMGMFVGVGVVISWLSEQMHRARRRAEETARELKVAHDELKSAHDTLELRVRERTAELHFQKTLLESQSEASLDGILAVGDDGRVIFANRRFREMWGLNGAESMEGIRAGMKGRLATQGDPLAVAEAGGNAPGELVLANGRTVERYGAAVVDGEGRGYGRVWFFRDVTERMRLQREILEAGERERQRIGQDLHDDLCQQLTGIACMGQVLQQRLDAFAREGAASAARMVELVQRATERARDLAKGLQPVELQRHGLPSALQDLCASVEGMFGVTCTFRGSEVAVDEVVGTQLFRIAQEAVTNAVRHGRPGEVLIDLVAAGDRVILTVEDDGVGMPEEVPVGGLGLHTMGYRARAIGGTLSVERRSPQGTVVTCAVGVKEDVGGRGVGDGATSAVETRTMGEGETRNVPVVAGGDASGVDGEVGGLRLDGGEEDGGMVGGARPTGEGLSDGHQEEQDGKHVA